MSLYLSLSVVKYAPPMPQPFNNKPITNKVRGFSHYKIIKSQSMTQFGNSPSLFLMKLTEISLVVDGS